MLYILSFLLTILSFQQSVFGQTDCDLIHEKAKKQFVGCGQGLVMKTNYFQEAIDCYNENGEYDKAIKICESKCYNINGIGYSKGFMQRLPELYKIKYGKKRLKKLLKTTHVEINIFSIFHEMNQELPDSEKFHWNEIISVKVSFLGKNYGLIDFMEDAEICNDFLDSKKSLKELETYFNKRWEASLLYQGLTN